MGAAAPGLAVAGTILGTGLSAISYIQQQQAAGDMARYNAAVQRNNQILAEKLAEDARKRGETEVQLKRRETAFLVGRQRAQLASQGVVVDEGSALDLTSDTVEQGELEALNIRANAEREAITYLAQAQGFEAAAALSENRANAAAAQFIPGLGGVLLTGGTQVAEKWYNFSQAGANPNPIP